MTTPEDTSETLRQEGSTAPSSGKVKVVALLLGIPSVAMLFRGLYTAIYSDTFRDDPRWHVVVSTAVFGAMVFFPLYYAVKIWRGPTLKNLRRGPFIAAFLCYIGGILIYRRLSRPWESAIEWEDLLSMIFALVAYLVVKKVMVSWLEMPELKDSGLSIARKRGLWMLYCFSLWAVFPSGALMEVLEPSGIDLTLTVWAKILVPIVLAAICYYVGKSALNVNRG